MHLNLQNANLPLAFLHFAGMFVAGSSNVEIGGDSSYISTSKPLKSKSQMPVKEEVQSKSKETAILDAAQRQFANYGYFKVTMEEIAEDIGMAKASLYYYFPTKEAIFRAVIGREQEEFLSQITNILHQTLLAKEKLIRFVEHRLELTENLINLNRLNQQVWHEVKPIFKDLFDKLERKELQYLVHVLQEGVQKKEFTLHAPKDFAEMILHVLQGLRLRLFQRGDYSLLKTGAKNQFEQETVLFINMLICGISKQK